MVFLQNSLRSLAGNFRAEFDPEQGIRIPEQGIWRPPGNPTRQDFAGRRARGPHWPGPRLRRGQAYTALLTMCGSRLSLSLHPRPDAQVRPRPEEWPALARRQHQRPDPAVRIGTFPRRVVTARLSVADRVLDQFSADGAEENYLYCNPAPNGDKRHADR
jgi:hypothetical protein